MKNGSLTLIGMIFLIVVGLVLSYQLIIYQDYQKINYNLTGAYETRLKKLPHKSSRMDYQKKELGSAVKLTGATEVSGSACGRISL